MCISSWSCIIVTLFPVTLFPVTFFRDFFSVTFFPVTFSVHCNAPDTQLLYGKTGVYSGLTFSLDDNGRDLLSFAHVS